MLLGALPETGAREAVVEVTARFSGGAIAKKQIAVSVQVPTQLGAVEAYAPGVVGERRKVRLGGIEREVEVIDGLAITEGDIVLGELEAVEAAGRLKSGTCNWGFHTDFSCSPWSGGVVGYSFANNWGDETENARMRAQIEAAIAHWEARTGIDFVRRSSGEWLQFRDGSGCSSTIGRAVITGFDSQSITLGNECSLGNTIHEIGHAIGLYHLPGEIAAGRFRADLYYRIAAAVVHVPPLRERPLDIPVLARCFLERACIHLGRPPLTLSPRAASALAAYAFPGNVRELLNAMEFVAATCSDPVVDAAALPLPIAAAEEPRLPTPRAPAGFRSIADEIAQLERRRIEEALAITAGNQRRAAALIGMPRRTLVSKLRRYRHGDVRAVAT